MEITETRKQIIQLIEQFMNKTLSEWCMFYYEWSLCVARQNDIFYLETWEFEDKTISYIADNELYLVRDIIGHYDITAVLNYITTICCYICERKDEIIDTDFIYYYLKDKSEFKIPNKPLHLYTEDEDKNLLELLQKIWMK